MSKQFSYKLTDTGIYTHLLYRVHPDAQKLDEAGVLEIIQRSVRHQNKYLQHKECSILVFADSFATIPEQGIGGRCAQPDLINIFINPEHEGGVSQNVERWLPSALAHELYHARRYVTHQFGTTLGKALIEEGLPSMFEEFMEPDLTVPYAHHLNRQELAQAWKKAKPFLNSKRFNRDDWFYGGSGIKKWTGYSLGYDIVHKYMEKQNANNPAELVDIPAQDFFRFYSQKESPAVLK